MNILHVCANPKPTEESVCKQLATQFFAALVENNPDVNINNVDLYQDKPPFFSYEAFRAAWNPVFDPEYEVTPDEDNALTYARRHGEALLDADILVLTTPMWNFSVPSILKAWMDQILVPGITFDMTAKGPQSLLKVRKIVLLVASGGVYKEDDPRDQLSGAIRNAFGFIGIDDVEIAWADGQNPLFFDNAAEHMEWAIEAAREIAEEIAETAGESDE